MTRAESRTWYRIALARDGGRPPALVAAAGEHLGAAIDAAQARVAGSWPLAADVAAEAEIPLGESVGKDGVVLLGDAPADTPAFRWPTGVVPQLGRTDAVIGATAGWAVLPDPKLFVVEAQTEAAQLVDLFLGLIERLPAADNLEVRVMPHFEDAGVTDVWLTSRVNAKRVLRFLDDHDDALIAHGFVELSIYVRGKRGTLRLTEHKTVVWFAEDRALEADLARWLGELRVPHVDALVTVAAAPHFHYRTSKGRDRKRLGEDLFKQRLRRVTQPVV